ncbi:MAG: hypothetical protein LBV12_07190 [Puniceicoccales bacterium]|nr:hypothetical protein [Puniceicoccales bacterium]
MPGAITMLSDSFTQFFYLRNELFPTHNFKVNVHVPNHTNLALFIEYLRQFFGRISIFFRGMDKKSPRFARCTRCALGWNMTLLY